jgi:TATA-box binding protein (TBP) (component of TFIID and TFIIIB)
VEARLEAFGREFLDAFHHVERVAASLTAFKPLPLSLSTITMTGTLDAKTLPVDAMRLAAELALELGEELDFALDDGGAAPGGTGGDKRKRRHAQGTGGTGGDKRFRYQLPLKRRGKSLKLFHNGSVHATGCTSPLEFLEMVQALTRFVRDTGDLEVRLLDFDIQLINTMFGACCHATGRPVTVAPGALLRRLASGSGADFDTERHPSVKMPLMVDGKKCATVCVFQTGSVSIMGARRPAHVAMAYEMACRALDACAAEVCAPNPKVRVRTTTARAPLVLEQGYPSALYWCCCCGAG